MTTTMTIEQVMYLSGKQREWSEMYKIQENIKRKKILEQCREYQTMLRRRRGVPIKNALSNI